MWLSEKNCIIAVITKLVFKKKKQIWTNEVSSPYNESTCDLQVCVASSNVLSLVKTRIHEI